MNYGFGKRQKEIKRQQKREEKAAKKRRKKEEEAAAASDQHEIAAGAGERSVPVDDRPATSDETSDESE